MSSGNGTLEKPPYIECEGCGGRGFVKARVDVESRIPGNNTSKSLVIRDHDRCNGAGIMILREHSRGDAPYYGAPKLW